MGRENYAIRGVALVRSADPCRLEDTLCERLAARPRGGLDRPVLVLVPTRLLVRHLKRVVARRLGAALAVHFTTYAGLARRALERAFVVPPRRLCAAALESALEAILAQIAGSEATQVRLYPGALRSLLATCRELRDAGVEPRALDAARRPDGAVHPVLATVYPRYCEALSRLETLPEPALSDDAGMARAALPHLGAFLRSQAIARAIHYGAYELVGYNLEILVEVARHAETEVFLPAASEGPAFAYARRFPELLEVERAEELAGGSDADRAAWISRLSSLYDPGAVLEPWSLERAPALELRHVQGAEAELRTALLRALALSEGRGGRPVPLDEIAIVARSLESYLPFLGGVARELGVPVSTTASTPLARDGHVQAFLLVLKVLATDLERGSVFAALRDPRFALLPAPLSSAVVDRWDRESREKRVHSRVGAWRAILEASTADAGAGDPRGGAGAPALLACIEALEAERQAWTAVSTLSGHATHLRRLAARAVSGGDESLALGRLLSEIDALAEARAALGGYAGETSAAQALDLLERLAAEPDLDLAAPGARGVQVLELMQARGLTFRAVIWIGFHDGCFPRRSRPDPFLADAARREIAARTRRPLATREGATDEERLLLAMVLAAARERVVVSFQRADDDGSRQARSSALRELARAWTGRADAGALVQGTVEEEPDEDRRRIPAAGVPSHAGDRALALARSPSIGLLTASDAAVAAAVRARHPTDAVRYLLRALGRLDAVSAASLDWLDVLESYEVGDGAADGVTGIPFVPPSALYATEIEHLARCPLAFFQRCVLEVRRLEESPRLDRLEENVLGKAVHATLEALYRRLAPQGKLEPHDDLPRRALALLEPLWRAALDEAVGASRERLHGVVGVLAPRWLETLRRFVLEDVKELGRASEIEVETTVEAQVEIAVGRRVRLGGRIDRLWKASDGLHVDDFKTSGEVATRLKPAAILKGHHLQLPVYREVAAAARGIGVGAVHARLIGTGPDSDGEPAELSDDELLRRGVLETIAVALALLDAGRFPFRDQDRCVHCEFRRTCRRTHDPSIERREKDPAIADYRDLERKHSKGAYTLAEVRAKAGHEDGESADVEAGGDS